MWGGDPGRVRRGLGLTEKSVPYLDEDTVTISIEAAKNALKRAGIDPSELGAVLVGTESKPYAVKPTGTIVAEAIGATPHVLAADFEFACKAGTEALQCCIGMVGFGMMKYAMAIGADTAQGAPGDDLEYSAAAGGSAYIISSNLDEAVAIINGAHSYVTNTPDFWRRAGQKYPKHTGPFTGKPAYFRHIIGAAKALMEEMGTTPKDYDYAVFHQPNGAFPVRVGKMLGFPIEKIKDSLVTPYIGNTYAGSALTGLAALLDKAKPGDRILVVSFGSGAGSDAFDITVAEGIEEKRGRAPSVWDYINRRKSISYSEYLKFRRMIIT